MATAQTPADFGIGRLFWAIREAVIVADADSDRIVLWNPAAEALFGHTAVEARGLTVAALVVERLKERHRAGIARYRATGHGALIDSGRPVEVAALHKDGHELAVELTLTPLETGPGRFVLALVRDLTERRREEETRLQIVHEQAARAEAERTEAELRARAQQQAAMAELGQRALDGTPWPALLDEAVALAASTLGVEYAAVLEAPAGAGDEEMLLRAGVGWRAGLIGRAFLSTGQNTHAGRALRSGEPIIIDDLRAVAHEAKHAALCDHGVVSGLAVAIAVPDRPWGVLAAYAARSRPFTVDDANFLRAIANVLGTAIARGETEATLRFQARLLEVVEEAVIATDLAGRIIYWNHFAETLYGWSAREVLGRNILTVTPTTASREQAAAILAGLREGRRWAGEMALQRRDGTSFPALVTDAPVHDDRGNLIAIIGISVDITARKRVEEAERRARAAAEHARRRAEALAAERAATLQQLTDGVIVADTTGRITFVNAAARDLHGVAELGVAVTEYSAAYHLLTVDGAPYQPTELPLARAVMHGETVVDAEWRIRRPDGREIVAQGSATPVVAEDGTRLGAVLTLRDVTDQRSLARQKDELLAARDRALAEASEAQRRLAFLARASERLASSLDVDATLRDMTRLLVPGLADWCAVDIAAGDGALERLAVAHADPAKEELVREMGHRYPPAVAEPSLILSVLRGGRSLFLPAIADAELPALTRDAEHLALVRAIGMTAVMVVPLRARGRVLGVLSLVRTGTRSQAYEPADLALAEDLARRAALALDNARLYQEAQAAIGARDQFLTIAAHELRTPITSVQGYAELLLRAQAGDRLTPERLTRGLAAIGEAVSRLSRLTEDLLDVSRLRAGQFPLRPRPLDLAGLVARVADRHRTELGPRHRLIVELPDEPCPVVADADRMEQVLTNLLGNAAKYSPDGGAIRLSLAPEATGVELRVGDEGIGLPAGAATSIFAPFGRAPNAKQRQIPGLGLGLHICRDIVERHGGRIWAESSGEGHGTSIGIWLPTARPPHVAGAPAAGSGC